MTFIKPSPHYYNANQITNYRIATSGNLISDGVITTGASAHTWTSWTAVTAAAPTYDIQWFEISTNLSWSSAINNSTLLEMRYTLSGNSFTFLEKTALGGVAQNHPYPIRIPAGATIEYRVKGAWTSTNYANFFLGFHGFETPHSYIAPYTGCYSVGIVDDASNSRGTTITETVGSFGSPVNLGSTTTIPATGVRCIVSTPNSTAVTAATNILGKLYLSGGTVATTKEIALNSSRSSTGEQIDFNRPLSPFTYSIPVGSQLQIALATLAACDNVAVCAQLFYR